MAQEDDRDPAQEEAPNRASRMEQAEGSRETVTGGDRQGGITNRGLDREREAQRALPDRGHSKSEERHEPESEESER